MKVLIIGLDGATWDLIKPWAEEGKLPTFKKLMENGVWGYLESTIPPSTASAWTSFITGKTVEKHKIFNFITPDEHMKSKLNFVHQVKDIKIWEIFGMFNLKSVIINFPLAFPPPKINGIFISGMFTPSKYEDFVYPKEYKKFLPKDYIIEPVPVGDISSTKRLEILKKSLIARFKVLKSFLKENWNFLFILIRETDILQHFFWTNKKILLDFYMLIDQELSNIVDFCEKNDITLILMSDHGFQQLKGRFHITEFLKRKGYLVLKTSKTSHKLTEKIKEKIWRFLVTHPQLKDVIKKIFHIKVKHTSEVLEHIDFLKTKAFHLGGYIYINSKKDEERKTILHSLISEMKKEGIEYFLLNTKKAHEPVMVVTYKNWSYELSDEESENIITPPFLRNGTHALHGIFLTYGPDIKNTGEEIKNVKIYDIAPTILHMFNLPIPNDMDGRVLLEIFKEDSEIAKRKPVYVEPSYYEEKLKSISEKERIRERVRELKNKNRKN